eukprot:Nk52_evm25s1671 gene=Nk52_evmTU25s1671
MASNGEKTLCVWVHGFEGDADTFGNYPVLFEEMYGFETVNFVYESNEDIDEVVEKLNALINNLYLYDVEGNRKAIFVGHSCGGLVIGRYLKKKLDPERLQILGLGIFDSPIRGIDKAKQTQHKQWLANVLKSNWKLALALAGILVLVGSMAKGYLTDKLRSERERLEMLNDRQKFLMILFDKWEAERAEIIKLYEKYSDYIPVFNVYCAQSSMNYFNPCTLGGEVENYEFGANFAVFHPIIHTLLFTGKNGGSLPLIGEAQTSLLEATKEWMALVCSE